MLFCLIIVINTERFFSTRDVPKTVSCSTVRKLVYAAWLSGFLVGLLPAATNSGIRHDINATHYTVVCKPDTSYLLYRVILTDGSLIQLVIPIAALICINIILARRAWKMGKRRIYIQQDNVLRATMRSHKIQITYTLVVQAFYREKSANLTLIAKEGFLTDFGPETWPL